MIPLYILIFVLSCVILVISGKWLIESLTRIAKFLGWKEFVVAFFTVALGTSLPNIVVGVLSALNKIPQLSLGDIVGGNILDLTLVVALAAFISKKGIYAPSRTVQGSSLFTIGSAILPLVLILDGSLSRIDGIILISAFIIYISWLFRKEDRFKKVYDGVQEIRDFKYFLRDIGILTGSIILLILGATGIVQSSSFFSQALNLPLIFIGIFIVGVGNALPEAFFSFRAAREGQDWMILGNLMGSVMILATLVLGIVSLIYPIEILDFPTFAIGRFFLIVSALFFLIFLRTGKKITRKEAVFLFLIFLAFVITEIINQIVT